MKIKLSDSQHPNSPQPCQSRLISNDRFGFNLNGLFRLKTRQPIFFNTPNLQLLKQFVLLQNVWSPKDYKKCIFSNYQSIR